MFPRWIICMNFCFQRSGKGGARKGCAAFNLMEVLISLVILGMVMSGLIYGYVQSNRMAEWSSMSLAAQSYASEGAESARAADWRPRDWPVISGYETMDELTNGTLITNVDFLDIPSKGTPSSTNFQFWVTNYISITNIYPNNNPALRQIRSDAVWTYPWDGKLCTNTVILLRASDQ
jgi:prepilin-type N-terminal cleavage/methylation domain-containing protein